MMDKPPLSTEGGVGSTNRSLLDLNYLSAPELESTPDPQVHEDNMHVLRAYRNEKKKKKKI